MDMYTHNSYRGQKSKAKQKNETTAWPQLCKDVSDVDFISIFFFFCIPSENDHTNNLVRLIMVL